MRAILVPIIVGMIALLSLTLHLKAEMTGEVTTPQCQDNDYVMGSGIQPLIPGTVLKYDRRGRLDSKKDDICRDGELTEHYCSPTGEIMSQTIPCVWGCAPGGRACERRTLTPPAA